MGSIAEAPQEKQEVRCECGSTDLVIAYRVPVYAYISEGRVSRAVVPEDPNLMVAGVVRCITCDRYWLLEDRPEFGMWPQWEFEDGEAR